MAVLDSAVLVELEAGADWSSIAAALGLSEATARSRYEDTARMWLDEAAASGLDLAVFGRDRVDPDEDPRGMAEALDQWYARHSEPWETPGPIGIV